METIKFGVWGLGRIGFVHCRHFSDQQDMYELVAGCDHDKGKVARLTADHPCAGYDDAEAFLAHAHMELVIIATRSMDHVAHAGQALTAGKTVLLEKPIAVNEDGYQELRQLDQDYPGKLFFLHNHRFEPAVEHVQTIIASGILGRVEMVKLCRHHPYRRRADWQTLLAYGGGQLNCWGPHVIDHALQFLSAPVKDVWSHLKRVNTPGDADDHVKIVLLGKNGVVVDLEISDMVALKGAFITVYGDRGTLICADEKVIQLRYIEPEFEFLKATVSTETTALEADTDIPWREETIPVEPDGNMWELVEIAIARHLYRAIREGVPFPIVNADALEVVRVTELVKQQNPQFNWKQ